ncbi:MAG: HD domain-containing protein [Clostridia bacterium]|nr:HD domain-containing protein [Clostridia bacterium]
MTQSEAHSAPTVIRPAVDRLNQDISQFVIDTIEEIINTPLEDMLSVTAGRISEFFDTPYACIHFTKSLALPKSLAVNGLNHCPLATLAADPQKEAFMAMEEELNEFIKEQGQPLVHEPSLFTHPRWPEFLEYFNFRSGLSLPLRYQNEIFGVIDIFHTKDLNLRELNPRALNALGSCLFGAVKKEVLIKSLQERDDIIEAFARTIEAADKYTGGHVDRVSRYAQLIGTQLGLSQEELKTLKRAALLHDVGKIGVPESILNKQGPFNPEERRIMETHPLIAQGIFQDISDPGLVKALDGVLYHHERIDGKGYPFGLKGDAIPLPARIIAVADTFDALTSDRPYRSRLPLEKAVAILKECRGTQLDRLLVDLFLEQHVKN